MLLPALSDIETLLERLIAFETTFAQGTIAITEFIEAWLDDHGVPHTRIDYETGHKTNLFATIGPDGPGGVVLSGHLDVVPVTGQNWASNPFELVRRNDRLFGRGTCDMKGFAAVVLAMVPWLVRQNLKRPIHLAFSCDEEVGCKGVRPLVRWLQERTAKPEAVIVGEPSLMAVVTGHKGIASFETTVTGHEAHSSLTDRGVNAIMVAADLIGEISRLRADLTAAGDPAGRFDPPFTTIHVGTIQGGTARNIIPRQCQFQWETRVVPGTDPRAILARLDAFAATLVPAMQAISPAAGITTQITNEVAALAPEANGAAEALARHCAGANATEAVSYCAEAGLFQQAGFSTVICGPGSIEQAHKPDEFIAASELARCRSFIERLAARLSL